ncbi:hypothetical protein [Actinoplanes sp. URMC 104]|uniref:hypothetical protein n=1 Tax=Actinoplanes sp. URMC 104 TaxID=3423409 RepID=UPI003F1C28C9
MRVSLTVGRSRHDLDVEPARTLGAVLRDDCGLHTVRLDCADGTCAGCSVLLDGELTRACLMLAVQCDGSQVDGLKRPHSPGVASP